MRVDSVNVEKRERRLNYQFGHGYKMGRDEREVAKLKAKVDVSPIPEWISEKIIDKMVKVKHFIPNFKE